MLQPIGENFFSFLKKNTNVPAIPLPGVYPGEVKAYIQNQSIYTIPVHE